MRNVILIVGSLSSANFNVMLSFIRSAADDLIIHAVAASNENPQQLPQYSDVMYHALKDKRRILLNKKAMNKWHLFRKRVMHHVTANLDNYFPPKYERRLYAECERIIQDVKVEAIFSVCLPIQAHRCALSLVSKHKDIRLFPFWLDPFSNSAIKHDKLWAFGSRKLENNIFSLVPRIYAFGGVLNNNKVISPWKDKLVEVHVPYIKNRNINSSNNQIVFAGGFVKGIREPEPVFDILLEVVKAVKEVSFHFYVRNPEDYVDYFIRSAHQIVFHPFVNREKLEEILTSAYMFLSVGNLTDVQIPSKTIEYVSYRKPILHFTGIDNDTALLYLNDYPDKCVIDVRKDKSDNAQKILSYLQLQHEEISWEELMKISIYKKCTPEYVREIIDL